MNPTTTALAIQTSEREIISRSSQDREERGQRLANLFVKFIGDLLPLLVQVRQDFCDKSPDETICGVRTFDEYCTGVLCYSRRRIQQLIAGQNPASGKHDGSANRKPEWTDEKFLEWESKYDFDKSLRKQVQTLSDREKLPPEDVLDILTGEMYSGTYSKPQVEAAIRIVTEESQPDHATATVQQAEIAQRLQEEYESIGINIQVTPARDIGKFNITYRNMSEAEIQQDINKFKTAQQKTIWN